MYVNSSKRKEGRRVNYGGPPLSTLVQCIKHARSACVCVPWPRFSSRNSIYDFDCSKRFPFPFPTDQLRMRATDSSLCPSLQLLFLPVITASPLRTRPSFIQTISQICEILEQSRYRREKRVEKFELRGVVVTQIRRGQVKLSAIYNCRDSKLLGINNFSSSERNLNDFDFQTICEILSISVRLEREERSIDPANPRHSLNSLMTQNSFSISTSTAHCCSGIVARMRLSARIAIYDSRRYK